MHLIYPSIYLKQPQASWIYCLEVSLPQVVFQVCHQRRREECLNDLSLHLDAFQNTLCFPKHPVRITQNIPQNPGNNQRCRKGPPRRRASFTLFFVIFHQRRRIIPNIESFIKLHAFSNLQFSTLAGVFLQRRHINILPLDSLMADWIDPATIASPLVLLVMNAHAAVPSHSLSQTCWLWADQRRAK